MIKLKNDVIIKVEDLTIAYDDKPVIWDNDVDFINNSITAIIVPMEQVNQLF